MVLSEKLAALRKEHGYSQLYVAERLQVSRQAISRWEVGSSVPSTENLLELSRLYGVSLDELVGHGAESPTQVTPEREAVHEEPVPHQQKIDMVHIPKEKFFSAAPWCFWLSCACWSPAYGTPVRFKKMMMDMTPYDMKTCLMVEPLPLMARLSLSKYISGSYDGGKTMNQITKKVLALSLFFSASFLCTTQALAAEYQTKNSPQTLLYSQFAVQQVESHRN